MPGGARPLILLFWLHCANPSCFRPSPMKDCSVCLPNSAPASPTHLPLSTKSAGRCPSSGSGQWAALGCAPVPFGSHPEALPSISCLFPSLVFPVGLIIVITIKYYVSLEMSVKRVGFCEKYIEVLVKVSYLKKKKVITGKRFCGFCTRCSASHRRGVLRNATMTPNEKISN